MHALTFRQLSIFKQAFQVVEATIRPGLGATATLVVKQGLLEIGQWVIAGRYAGRVKALKDPLSTKELPAGAASPGRPVVLAGLGGCPGCSFF